MQTEHNGATAGESLPQEMQSPTDLTRTGPSSASCATLGELATATASRSIIARSAVSRAGAFQVPTRP